MDRLPIPIESFDYKNIKGFKEIYLVNRVGDLKRKSCISENGHFLKEKDIKKYIDEDGYERARVGSKTYGVHQLVAKAFIENPKNLNHINHKNGIKNDNRVENLEWVTVAENNLHKFRVLGHKAPTLGKRGIDLNGAKPVMLTKIKDGSVFYFGSMGEAAFNLGLIQTNISATARGIYKQYRGFLISFIEKEEYLKVTKG